MGDYQSEWYKRNRERLLPLRRKYNKEYSKRPYVIEKARKKNATQKERLRRKRYKKTPEGKIADKRYREKNKEKTRLRMQRQRLKMYGLTPETLKAMHEKQGKLCAICSKDISEKFHVDHCHETGRVRGLLCTACNMGLGLFKDDSALLRKAIDYLHGI